MKNARVLVTCVVFLLELLLSGCAASPSFQPTIPPPPTIPPTTTTTPPANHLIATPAQLVIRHGESWNFSLWKEQSLFLTGSSTLVESTWSVQEGAVGGSITGDGAYTAPAVNGTYHVIGASKSDPTNTVTATVTVGDGLTLSGDPSHGGQWGPYTVLLPNGHLMIEGGFEYTSNGKAIGRIDQYDPSTGTFEYWNTVEGVNSSATLLANGDVLLAGGESVTTDENGKLRYTPLADAQILRTGSGLIEKTGALNHPRNGESATLLQDGRVLIAGGFGKTAELYDPATGVFTETGSMSVGRAFGRAILFGNGKVLLTGGAPFELFDPVTNTFSVVDGLPNDVAEGTAVLLKDGRVLISGGSAANGTLTHEAYFYDPVTGQFTLAGKLLIARSGHSATLLADGTVLIAGGIDTPPPDDYTDGSGTSTTEIFDPATGTFTAGTSLITAGRKFSATLLSDGSVFFLEGGYTEIWRH